VLEVRNLKKSFGSLQAVADASFIVRPGELVGLLGPNGAGKTTTISMLTGLTAPDSGDVLIDGKPLRGDTDPNKARIGVVPQDLAIYDELSASANLRFFGSLYGLQGESLARGMESALTLVGLSAHRDAKVKNFSGGMKRRLNLAASVLHDPDILLLDEPTVGVDPQSRNAIFDNLEVLKQRGKTILYTTHYMEEVERLADRVIIMDHGRVIADEPIATLHARIPQVAGKQANLETVFLALTGRQLRD
jgi:ABC-2 type transport system ATP-binding protein